jgi:endonuclease G
MAPAADVKFSQKAMDDTFYLTNMSPQVGVGFNREYWAYLEEFCRKLTNEFKDVYVVTGPLYLPRKDPKFPNPDKWYVQYEVIGNPPNVAVPTHFFKVILAIPKNGGAPSLGGFVLPNSEIPNETPLERFVLPVDQIEKAAGSIFFSEYGNDKANRLPHLCKTTKCQTKLPRFIEQQRKLANGGK